MSEISREELIAFTEAHAKSSVAMEKICDRLGDVLKNQEKILQCVSTGIPTTITAEVVRQYDAIHKDTVGYLERVEAATKDINDTIATKLPVTLMEKINSSDMSKDIDQAKIFLSILTLVVIVTTVLMRFFFNTTAVTQDQVRQIVKSQLVYSQEATAAKHKVTEVDKE